MAKPYLKTHTNTSLSIPIKSEFSRLFKIKNSELPYSWPTNAAAKINIGYFFNSAILPFLVPGYWF